MSKVYKPKTFSPVTVLSVDISEGDTTIPVDDISVFPEPPSLATINYESESAYSETIKYNSIDTENAQLTEVERGIEGEDQSWPAGFKIARIFTALEWDVVLSGIDEIFNRMSAEREGDIESETTLTE